MRKLRTSFPAILLLLLIAHSVSTSQLRSDSTDVAKLLDQAKSYLDAKDFEGTMRVCTKAISLDSLRADAYWFRALALKNLEQYERAVADLRKVNRLAPQFAPAYGNLGWYLILSDHTEQARPFCRRAHELDSTSFDWVVNLGHTYLLTGDTLTARQYYEKSLELIKSEEELAAGPIVDFDLFIKKGWQVELCEKEKTWMKVEFARVITARAQDFLWNKLDAEADSLYEIAEYAEAEAVGRRALQLAETAFDSIDTRTSESLTVLALIYGAQGRYVDAEPLYKRALRIYEKALGSEHPSVAASLSNLATLYYAQGRYADAEPLFKRALRIYEKALGSEHSSVAASLNNLATLYNAQGRYADAEPLYKRALGIDEKVLGSDHADVGTDLNNLATLYNAQSRYADAEPLYKRALGIREKALGAEHPDVANSLNNLAVLYKTQGRYADAEPLYKRALGILEKALGSEHPDVATSLNNLATLYKDQGRYADAEPLYKRTLGTMEKALGSEHPDVATSLNNLATLYYAQGHYADAEPLFKRALGIREKALGSEHPSVAASLNNLATLYNAQGRYADAEPLYKRALGIDEKVLGSDHPDVGTDLNNLAGLYNAQGRYADAEPLYKRAHGIREKALGFEHPSVATSLNDLATLYYAQGRYADAEPLYKRALGIREKALGSEHPDVATSLNDLATLYKDQGRYADAEPLYKRTLGIYEKALGSEHPSVATSLSNLATLYNAQGRYADAEPLFKRTLGIREKALGSEHPSVATSLNNLATLYNVQGRYADAEPLYMRALGIYEKALGSEHPDVATSLNNLATLYNVQGRYADAEPLYKRTLGIREKALGSEHPDVATSLNNLAILYYAQGRYADAEPLYKRTLGIMEKALGSEHPSVATSLNNLATLYKDQGRYADAEPLYLAGQQILLHTIAQNFPSLSEAEKTAFYHTIQYNFELFNSFALQRRQQNPGILGSMLDNQLATKALLLDATSKVNRLIRNSGDSIVIEQLNLWISTKEYLAKVYTLTKSQQRLQGIKLDSLEQAANETEKEVSRRSETFKSAYEKKLVTWQEVRSVLKPDEVAIELIRFRLYNKRWTDTVCYAALIITPETKDHPGIVVLNNGKELEQECLSQYKQFTRLTKGIAGRSAGRTESAPKQGAVDAGGLYTKYWSRIDSALGSVKRVYLSVDGVYNNINVETLKRPDGSYVAEHRDIRMVVSPRDLAAQQAQRKAESDKTAELFGYPKYDLNAREQKQLASKIGEVSPVKAFAYLERGDVQRGGISPLPGTEKEVTSIDELLRRNKWRPRLHTQQNALEEEVKAVQSPRVLHIATHGFFQQDVEQKRDVGAQTRANTPVQNPLLRSGLLLAGAERSFKRENADSIDIGVEDGILTAYEAMNMNLDQTELVVLSACETGLGEVRNGEGVYGLQRAFQVAGARYVLMSLWKVDDEATQELMRMFYSEWMKGGDVCEAFKEAQRKLREKYPPPYYWGAFVMVGL